MFYDGSYNKYNKNKINFKIKEGKYIFCIFLKPYEVDTFNFYKMCTTWDVITTNNK